jgi:hypothetical protein
MVQLSDKETILLNETMALSRRPRKRSMDHLEAVSNKHSDKTMSGPEATPWNMVQAK